MGTASTTSSNNAFVDRYVKIVFPQPGVDYPSALDLWTVRETMPREQWPFTRTYTLRWVDPEARELAIDFVVHGDEGLAGPWAATAQPGEALTFTGPGGAYNPNPEADWYLFAGDEAALPAIAASIESLPAGAVGLAFLEVGSRGRHSASERSGRAGHPLAGPRRCAGRLQHGCWSMPWPVPSGRAAPWTSLRTANGAT